MNPTTITILGIWIGGIVAASSSSHLKGELRILWIILAVAIPPFSLGILVYVFIKELFFI